MVGILINIIPASMYCATLIISKYLLWKTNCSRFRYSAKCKKEKKKCCVYGLRGFCFCFLFFFSPIKCASKDKVTVSQ